MAWQSSAKEMSQWSDNLWNPLGGRGNFRIRRKKITWLVWSEGRGSVLGWAGVLAADQFHASLGWDERHFACLYHASLGLCIHGTTLFQAGLCSCLVELLQGVLCWAMLRSQ